MSSREGLLWGCSFCILMLPPRSARVRSKGGGQAAHEEPQLTEMDDPGVRRRCIWLRGGSCRP